MRFLTLDYIKQHSRIDFECEDTMLELYADSAEDTILEWCNRSYEDIIETYGKFPPKLLHAALMLVDISYQNRSPVSPQNLSIIPYGNIDVLIKPYMIL